MVVDRRSANDEEPNAGFRGGRHERLVQAPPDDDVARHVHLAVRHLPRQRQPGLIRCVSMPRLLIVLGAIAVVGVGVLYLVSRTTHRRVPFYDFETKTTTLVAVDALRPGAVLVQIQGRPEPVYVDAAQLQQGPYRHPRFEGQARSAIQTIAAELADVHPLSFEEWEDGFRRDQDASGEIATWSRVAAVLRAMTERFDLGHAARQDCYRVLVACCSGPRETVRARLKPQVLTDDQVRMTIESYFEVEAVVP